jgi:hypothetical protein
VMQPSGIYRDLPIDSAHGPYPTVAYGHGSYGFRTEALPQMEHWASRGFVVAAVDIPGLTVGDNLQGIFIYDAMQAAKQIVGALEAPAGETAFLLGHVDPQHRGFVGRGPSASAALELSGFPGLLVEIAASGGCSSDLEQGDFVRSTLLMGAVDDVLIPYDPKVKGCFDLAKPTKRAIGLLGTKADFLSGLCQPKNDGGLTFPAVAEMYGVKDAAVLAFVFPCSDAIPEAALLNHTTTAVLEEKLTCTPGNQFDGIQAKYPAIADLVENL